MAKLIQDYSIEMKEPPCMSGAPPWTVEVHLKVDISEVLPYLNAELKNCIYNHELKELTYKEERRYVFRSREIHISNISDKEEGNAITAEIVDRINQIWERKDGIKPNFEQKKLPSAIDIYKLLPKTNCKECGFPTCLAFATALREGNAELSQCPHLSEEKYQKNRDEILKIL